jgi:hypothetical protein
MLIAPVCRLQGAYSEIAANIVLSYDADADVDASCPMGRTYSLGQAKPSTRHVPAANDAEALGKISVETVNPDPIMAGMRGGNAPPAVNRVKAGPALSAQGHKHPCIAVKRSDQGH